MESSVRGSTGASNVIVGGRFKPENWYKTIEDYGVTVWYSAPTAFRMLMGAGDEIVKQFDLELPPSYPERRGTLESGSCPMGDEGIQPTHP